MPIIVSWANDARTIILEEYGPSWTWEEFLGISAQEHQMMDQVGHRVDIIADARNTSLPERALELFPEIVRQAATSSHPNAGLYVVVGASRLIRTFITLYTRIYPEHGSSIRLVESIEEAYRIIVGSRSASGPEQGGT
ncbi:MAG: hypothetical protein Kow00124_20050 [Anaerolineae bacterium]